MYLWADGIHVNIRLEEHKLCLLVLIGVHVGGRKELIALADATGSPRSRGRTGCATARRGMRAPVLAVGDGALGFWNGAARGVPRDQGGPVLVPQDGKCPGCAAQVRPPGSEEGARGDLGQWR